MNKWLSSTGAFAIAALTAFMIAGSGAYADETISPARKDAIEKIIRDYLIEHPEVIEEAVEVLRARKASNEERRTQEALSAQSSAIYENPMSPVSGNAGADVTVVEFFDYQCGYCKKSLGTMVDLLQSDSKIRIVWKELPILGPASEFAARAALAANKQDRYLDFHIGIMSLRGRLTEDRVIETAAKIGLDVAQLQLDMNDPAIGAYLGQNRELADSIGIRGTPAFIVGKHFVPGAIDAAAMKRLIAQARAGG